MKEINMNKLLTSDISILMGESYKSPFTLFHEKMGNIEVSPDNTIYKKFTKHMFDLIATLYGEKTNKEITVVYPETNFHVDKCYLCNPDAMVMEFGKLLYPVKFELYNNTEYYKNIDFYKIDDGIIPIPTLLEMQAEMSAFNMNNMDLAYIYKNKEFNIINIKRNDEIIKEIEKAFEQFNIYLINKEPPPTDEKNSTTDTLNKLHPNDNGESVELTEEAINAGIELETIKKQIKKLSTVDKVSNENIIKNNIGNNTYGKCDKFTYSWKTKSRKGYIRVEDDPENIKKLESENIPYKIIKSSEYKTLEYSENIPK